MADQRISYNEQMVGAGHPAKADTLNRLALIEHNNDGTHNLLTRVTDPYRDPRADGAVGDGATDDKTALDLTFANSVVHIPEGTWMAYDIDLSAMSKLSGMGQGSVIKCNSLAADFVVGYQDYPTPVGKTNLTITDLVVDGNKVLGTFTGTGHGVDLRGYDEIYIDRLEVKNASGMGVIIANCAKVRIGTLVVHDCDKYGVMFDSNNGSGYAEDIIIDTIVAYNNGGITYSGISFADVTSGVSGSRRIAIGKVYAWGNGRDGIAFGRNAVNGKTGPSDITVGELHLHDNLNLGVEFFGCKDVTVGSINTYNNAYAGIGLYHGDETPTLDYAFCENIVIGQVITHDNGYDGIDICGVDGLHIGSVIAYNNSIGHTNTYSGVRLKANNPGVNVTGATQANPVAITAVQHGYSNGDVIQMYNLGGMVEVNNRRFTVANVTANTFELSGEDGTGHTAYTSGGTAISTRNNSHIHIGSLLAYDDQSTATQKYGFARENVVNGGHVSIGHIEASGNATADIAEAMNEYNIIDPIIIGEWDVTSIQPTYSGNVDGAGIRHSPFKVGGMYYGAGQTTGATIASLVRVPVPLSKVCTVHAYIQAATDSTLANQASYERVVAVLNNGTDTTLVGSITSLHTAESDAGMDVTIIGGTGVDYITVRVTGLAATTINWKAWVRVVEH